MHTPVTAPPIIELSAVGKSFARGTQRALPVLADITLSLADGEMVGLLGRSGCGKSTLLRIVGGLIAPSTGEVRYQGAPLAGPSAGIAVVFQTFALYPWLTVLQNVELGLDALALPDAEVRRRALAAIDVVGLDGFQSAFPRELSGGMRQRVGFARAIVSDPVLLLMDEPFSALDVLTAETLRTDFLDLWTSHQLSTRSVLMVTHNIEEAVLMCDRIVILGANPGHVVAQIAVDLPQPRNRLDPAFHAIVDQAYCVLTYRITAAKAGAANAPTQLVPEVSVNRLCGFLEMLATPVHGGHAILSKLALSLGLASDELLPIAAALQLLEFVELEGNEIRMTAAGRVFAQATTEERKQLFREHLVRFVPLAAHIRQILEEREEHRAPRARFEYELEDHLHPGDAQQTLRAIVGWGRYAELFSYDDEGRSFALF